jgi:hypothetical protein
MRAFGWISALFLMIASHVYAGPIDWSVRVTPYDQVFPALELSQARRQVSSSSQSSFGAGSGLIAVRLRAHHAHEKVQLRVDGAELATPTHLDVELPEEHADYELHPQLRWDPTRIQLGARATTLRFSLSRDDGLTTVLEKTVALRPVSEALYFVRDGTDSVDLSWIFAAYVDENDAVTARIADLALQSGVVDKFTGYRDADASQVYRQVWSVWQALIAHGIRYSNADPGIARGPHEFSQRVRLLEETWNDRSANCIDGSVLIASVLQRIGLRSFLVLVPGHAFVGFYIDADAHRAAYLETTLLGAVPPSLRAMPDFASTLDTQDASRAGIASFAAALASGSARYARVSNRMDGRHRPDYAVIDIADARAFGIEPIVLAPLDRAASQNTLLPN